MKWWIWRRNESVFIICVVTVILGVSLVQLKIGELKTRDVRRKADIDVVGRAMDYYLREVGHLPKATPEGKIIACGDEGLNVCEWGEENMTIRDVDGLEFLKSVPQDPQTHLGKKYVYEVDESLKKFKLYAALEYVRDPVVVDHLTVGCGTGVQCNWYVHN